MEHARQGTTPVTPARRFVETIGGFGLSGTRVRVILALAAPVILGMLTQTAVNLVDTAMVGRLPTAVSVPGQAALGISLPIFWAIGGFLSSIQVGTQAIVARRYGEGQKDLAGRALMNSLGIAVLTSVILSGVAIWAVPYIFPFFHSDPEVIRWGVPYLQLRLVGLLSMVATASVQGFFDGVGKTYVHMVAAIVMNLLNIFGNWVFIFGHLGAPRLQVTGAGLASTISTYVGLAIMIAWTLHRRTQRDYRPYRVRNVNGRLPWDILPLGIPSGIATVGMMAGFLLFMKIVGRLDMQAGHGAVFAAATKDVIDIMSVTFMSAMAFGTGTATLVGQALGRGKARRAELFGWESVKLGVYFFGILGVLTALFPDVFLAIFTKDVVVIDAARPVMRLLGMFEWAIGGAMILMQAMFGAGDAKFVGFVTLALNFAALVPLAWLFGVAFGIGLMGMWIALIVYVLLVAGILGYKFYEGRWKHLEV